MEAIHSKKAETKRVQLLAEQAEARKVKAKAKNEKKALKGDKKDDAVETA
jgi:hypothetical protein